MSEPITKKDLEEFEERINAKFNAHLEAIKTIIVTVGIVREHVTEVVSTKPKSITKVLKGSEIPHDPITKVVIKDLGKIKTLSDFLAAIGKTKVFGEEFYKGILAASEMSETDEDLVKLDTIKTKETRIANKIKFIYESKLSKSEEHVEELTAIFETYKKNAAMNIHILPTTYSIGCNQAMLNEIENGKSNGVSYSEQEIIPDAPDETKNNNPLNLIKEEPEPKVNILNLIKKYEPEPKVNLLSLVKKDESNANLLNSDKKEEPEPNANLINSDKKDEPEPKTNLINSDMKEEPEPKVNLLSLVKKDEPESKPNLLNLVKKDEPKVNLLNLVKKEEPKINLLSLVKKEEPKVNLLNLVKKDEPEPKANLINSDKKEEPEPNANLINSDKKEEPKVNLLNLVKKEEPKINLLSLVKKDEPKVNLLNLAKKDEPEPKANIINSDKKEELKPAEVPSINALVENGAKMGINIETVKPSTNSAKALLSSLIKK